MTGKFAYLKLYNIKYKAALLKQSKNETRLNIYLKCFCVLCMFLNPACQTNSSTSPTATKNTKPSSVKGDETVLPAEDSQKNHQCKSLTDRIDELDSLILRQGQAAKQALLQAKESCQGNSALDCDFWTGRATNLTRQIRELRQQHEKLQRQKSQNGCTYL